MMLVLPFMFVVFLFVGWPTFLMKMIQTTDSRAGDFISTPTHYVEDSM